MDLQLNNYKILYEKYATFVEMQNSHEFHHLVSFFSVSFGCHVLVSGYFFRKHFGDSEEFQNGLKDLTKSYGYVNVIGVDEFLSEDK